ncbi:MAG: hypothetical protein CVU48_05705 [Candidatus Cloacimonetes bacterium HGW-Cloacimonetes-1]|jgi:methanogenic corrinoid protein MtbC1|nr:MAG: hypothetical protein CVU48_05705 [Candidatus Cloacimonetes bacterium HGW-Cloacimonetes-1]
MKTINTELASYITNNLNLLCQSTLRTQRQSTAPLSAYESQKRDLKYLQDTQYTLQYLSRAIDLDSPLLFEEFIQWLKTLLTGLGFSESAILTFLRYLKMTLIEVIPDHLHSTLQIYLDLIDPAFHSNKSGDLHLVSDLPFWTNITQNYLDSVLSGRRNDAVSGLMHYVSDIDSIKQIYLNVLQPAQRQVGKLWHLNKISVAQEHYATGVTQLFMSQMYAHIFTTEIKHKRIVSVCVQGELHEIGLRMVTDILEMEGWDTWFLGANMPISGLIETLIEKQVHVLAVSATMTFHLPQVESIIKAVRAEPKLARIQILVGGYPFLIDNTLWSKLGADGFASDAAVAVDVAESLYLKVVSG